MYIGAAFAQPVNVPPGPPIICNAVAQYDASTNGATKLISGVSGKNIYICGFSLMAGGTVTVTLQGGTGTTCGTNTTKITPGYPMVAQTHIEDTSPFYRGLSPAAGADVCINTSAGVAVQANILYGQY